jgi:hypothetical protein
VWWQRGDLLGAILWMVRKQIEGLRRGKGELQARRDDRTSRGTIGETERFLAVNSGERWQNLVGPRNSAGGEPGVAKG